MAVEPWRFAADATWKPVAAAAAVVVAVVAAAVAAASKLLETAAELLVESLVA